MDDPTGAQAGLRLPQAGAGERSPLEASGELLAKLRHFRRHDELAVGLPAVVGEVLLVVLLRRVECAEGGHLGDDRTRPDPFGVQLGDQVAGDLLLLRRVVEDHRAVLRPHVVALAIQGGRIVNAEEHLQNLAVADLARVEAHLHHFGMASPPAADLLVGRVGHVAPRVARNYVGNALQLVVHRLEAPEAPSAEGGDARGR